MQKTLHSKDLCARMTSQIILMQHATVFKEVING